MSDCRNPEFRSFSHLIATAKLLSSHTENWRYYLFRVYISSSRTKLNNFIHWYKRMCGLEQAWDSSNFVLEFPQSVNNYLQPFRLLQAFRPSRFPVSRNDVWRTSWICRERKSSNEWETSSEKDAAFARVKSSEYMHPRYETACSASHESVAFGNKLVLGKLCVVCDAYQL